MRPPGFQNRCRTLALPLACALTFGSSTGSEAWAAARVLTLEGAVQEAMANNPSLQSAREKVTEREAAVSQSFSAHFPTLQALGIATNKKDAVNLGNPLFGGEAYNQYSVAFQGAVPVYHGGSIAAAVESTRQDAAARRADLQIQERNLALDVAQAWMDALLSRERMGVFRKEEVLQEEVLKTARARERIGRSEHVDVLQIQTQLALLRPQIEQSRNQAELAVAQLATLLGDRESTAYELSGRLGKIPSESMKKSVSQAQATLPELLRSEAQRLQVDESASASLGKHLPQVDVLGTWGRASFVKSDLLDNYSTAWNLGLQLTIPIFSGLSSLHERRVFAAQRAQAELSVQSTRDQVSLAQVQAQKTLSSAETVFRAAQEAYHLSRQLLDEAKRSYGFSMINYQQLLNVEKDALQAELSWQQSKHDLVLALLRWAGAQGYPLESLIGQIDRMMRENG